MKFLNPGFTICSSSCTLYATHTLTWNIHFIIIEKDFRRFWRKTLWRWTVWRIQIWCLINLTKVQFGEKYNLTKYLKLYRNISSNFTFRYKYLLNFTFPKIYQAKLSYKQNVKRPLDLLLIIRYPSDAFNLRQMHLNF